MHLCMNAEVIFTFCQAVPYASFCFLHIHQSQVANAVKPNYTLLTFAYMYAHVCVSPQAIQVLSVSQVCKRKNKTHRSVNLFENNSSNKYGITTGLCPDPTSFDGPLCYYHSNTRMNDSLIMLLTRSLLYHPTPNQAVAISWGCCPGSYQEPHYSSFLSFLN